MPPGALLAGSPGTGEKESELLYSAGGNNSCCWVTNWWCPTGPRTLASTVANVCGGDPNSTEVGCNLACLQEFLDVLDVTSRVLRLHESLRTILDLLEEVVCPAFPTIRIKMRSKLLVVVKDGLVHGNWVNQVDPQARPDVTKLAGLVLSHMIQKQMYALSNISDIRYQVLGIKYQVSGIRYQVSCIMYQVSGI